MSKQYNRYAIPPNELIVQAIKKEWDNPVASMEFEGFAFNIHSNRLRTFCRAYRRNEFFCSACKLPAQFFAVESFKRGNQKSFHINLYGTKDGEEVLFTHDHTLARCLGGANNLSNTTVMCAPCNSRKGTEEGKIRQQIRKDKCVPSTPLSSPCW